MREGSENGWGTQGWIILPVSKADEKAAMHAVAGFHGNSVDETREILSMLGLMP